MFFTSLPTNKVVLGPSRDVSEVLGRLQWFLFNKIDTEFVHVCTNGVCTWRDRIGHIERICYDKTNGVARGGKAGG